MKNIYMHQCTQGLVPDPAEEEQLIALNRPLLDAVPESDDFNFTLTDKILGENLCQCCVGSVYKCVQEEGEGQLRRTNPRFGNMSL